MPDYLTPIAIGAASAISIKNAPVFLSILTSQNRILLPAINFLGQNLLVAFCIDYLSSGIKARKINKTLADGIYAPESCPGYPHPE